MLNFPRVDKKKVKRQEKLSYSTTTSIFVPNKNKNKSSRTYVDVTRASIRARQGGATLILLIFHFFPFFFYSFLKKYIFKRHFSNLSHAQSSLLFVWNEWAKSSYVQVCGRVYCRHCVQMGMGEMAEGRKCVDCLGKRFSLRYFMVSLISTILLFVTILRYRFVLHLKIIIN